MTSMSPDTAMSPALTSAGPVAESWRRLGPSPSICSAICFTLRTMSVTSSRTPASDGELVQHVLDLDRGDRRALQRRQQHAAQRVAERQAEAALQRFGDEGRLALGSPPALTSRLLGFLSSCQFLMLTVMEFPWGLGGMVNRRCALAVRRSRETAGREVSASRPAAQDQTRRRLDGRTPLCGIGVTSRIEVIVKPTACSARKRALATRAGALDFDFERADAVFGGLLAGVVGGDLGGIGRRLAAALEAHHAGATTS